LRTGELVVALGHPFGLPGALSVGVLHAVPRRNDRWLQADIRLAPGNSGGPLATVDGMVIGINAMIVRGLGIAVPAAAVAAFAERVLETSDEDGA
jgi:serine protease Do